MIRNRHDQRRRPRRRVTRQSEARGARLFLHTALVGIVREVSREARVALGLPRQDQRTIFTEVNADLERAVSGLGVRFGSPEFVERARAIAAQWADRVLTHNRRQVLRQIREVLGVPFAGGEAAVLAQVGGFVQAATDLIVTIPKRLIDDVRETVLVAAPQGLRVEDLARQIEERFAVSESRAALIARDQTLKLSGSITRVRQTSAGIRSYIWSTSQDERVRPFHAELEGTVHSWDSPPVVDESGRREHPGQDFGCRCVAVPNLEGLDVEEESAA